MNVHPSITLDRITDTVEEAIGTLDNPGFCIACGIDVDNCDPDAREEPCEEYGAEELILMLA